MRLRRTAALGIIAGAVVAGCGTNASTSPHTTSLPTTTSIATIAAVPSTTTTIAAAAIAAAATMPPTTVPATTTTGVVADATTADPKILAQQLQAVLDRYRVLYSESRANPELPFVDQSFVDEMLQVVTREFYGVSLIPAWSAYRDAKEAVRDGPSGPLRSVVAAVEPLDSDHVSVKYCTYDDSITYSLTDGLDIDDSVVVQRATGTFVRNDTFWLLDGVVMGPSNESSADPSACTSKLAS
jgi:hypothetical protein